MLVMVRWALLEVSVELCESVRGRVGHGGATDRFGCCGNNTWITSATRNVFDNVVVSDRVILKATLVLNVAQMSERHDGENVMWSSIADGPMAWLLLGDGSREHVRVRAYSDMLT
eukprot:COSAG06_NODE_4451_length_4248_cov_14.062184_1_plen_115_part_00